VVTARRPPPMWSALAGANGTRRSPLRLSNSAAPASRTEATASAC
jgi:hypothetical protein